MDYVAWEVRAAKVIFFRKVNIQNWRPNVTQSFACLLWNSSLKNQIILKKICVNLEDYLIECLNQINVLSEALKIRVENKQFQFVNKN